MQEREVDRHEHEDNANVGLQPLPHLSSEEQDVHPHHDSDHRENEQGGCRRPSHAATLPCCAANPGFRATFSDVRTDPSDPDVHLVAQIHHVRDRDPTLGEPATLPIGSEAHRDVVDGDWTVGAFKWAPDDQGT